MILRPATDQDAAAISAIYNHVVLTSTATYQIKPETVEDRIAWLRAHGPAYPVIVIEIEQKVAAWGSLSPFHPREAFLPTVENSVYVHQDFRGQGLGKKVLIALIELAKELDYKCIIAAVDSEQEASLSLHRSLGFAEVGRLPEVGRKFDRWLSVVTLQLPLKGTA